MTKKMYTLLFILASLGQATTVFANIDIPARPSNPLERIEVSKSQYDDILKQIVQAENDSAQALKDCESNQITYFGLGVGFVALVVAGLFGGNNYAISSSVAGFMSALGATIGNRVRDERKTKHRQFTLTTGHERLSQLKIVDQK
jgi:hypothetical protein